MVKINFLMTAVAALIPLVVGFIWYNPKTFGKAWQKAADISDEKARGANMPLIFILTYVFSFLIALMLNTLTIHQFGLQSLLFGEQPDSDASKLAAQLLSTHGEAFRTFKHGALHGTITGLVLIMPVMAINALFERKGFKYIAINAGYWIVSCALMGGVVCQFIQK